MRMRRARDKPRQWIKFPPQSGNIDPRQDSARPILPRLMPPVAWGLAAGVHASILKAVAD
jgi:hypothetical protein